MGPLTCILDLANPHSFYRLQQFYLLYPVAQIRLPATFSRVYKQSPVVSGLTAGGHYRHLDIGFPSDFHKHGTRARIYTPLPSAFTSVLLSTYHPDSLPPFVCLSRFFSAPVEPVNPSNTLTYQTFDSARPRPCKGHRVTLQARNLGAYFLLCTCLSIGRHHYCRRR